MTIFAPSNTAFKFLRENPWTKNMTHEMMVKLLSRVFVHRRKLLPADIRNEMMVEADSGEKLRLNVYPKVFFSVRSSIDYRYDDITSFSGDDRQRCDGYDGT